MKSALCLHKGARRVSEKFLENEPAPCQTDTHHPIRHIELVRLVTDGLGDVNMRVVEREFAVTPSGNVFFGLLTVRNGVVHDDYAWTIGLRNSHDKTLRAGVCAGSRVFVCDNLAFYGEIHMFRTHTNKIEDDLGNRVTTMLKSLGDNFLSMDRQIAAYKAHEVVEAPRIITDAAQQELIDDQRVMPILRLFNQPPHAAFAPRTAWSLFNAFTEDDKTLGIRQLPERTRKLHAFFDKIVGLN